MLKHAAVTLAFHAALAGQAMAQDCATKADTAALKTAVIQQEMMVAALQCRETGAYNRFVTTYRGELQASDATLKAFFVRRGGEHGEAGYDTFKTKAANLSALAQARNTRAFCADARALLAAALDNRGSLMSFVDAHAADIGDVCTASRPRLARAAAAPVRVAQAQTGDAALGVPEQGLPFKVTQGPVSDSALGVPARGVPAMPYRQQSSTPPPARAERDFAVGVPVQGLPAIPYRQNAAPPPPVRMAVRPDDRDSLRERVQDEAPPARMAARPETLREQDTDSEEALPPRPLYYEARNGNYQSDYYARGYGSGYARDYGRDYYARDYGRDYGRDYPRDYAYSRPAPRYYAPRPQPRYYPAPSYGYQPYAYYYGR